MFLPLDPTPPILAEARAIVDVSIVRIVAISGGPLKDIWEVQSVKFVMNTTAGTSTMRADSTNVISKDIQ